MGCIYRIFFDDYIECYVGKTTNLKKRIVNHKTIRNNDNVKKWKLYQFINKIGWENTKFEVLETIDDSEYIKNSGQRELFYIKKYKSSLNKNMPCRSSKEYYHTFKKDICFKRNVANLKVRNKRNKKSLDYYYENKEILRIKRIEYRKKNNEKMKKHMSTKYVCGCGAHIVFGSKAKHLVSIKHSENLLNNILMAKEKLIYRNKNIDIRL